MAPRRRPFRFGRPDGFTLIEALVGSLLLALGAVVVCSFTARCLQNTGHGLAYEQAYRYLDECLESMRYRDLRAAAQSKPLTGTFTAPEESGYQFTIAVTALDEPDLYRVLATVTWQRGVNTHQVLAETLLYDAGDHRAPPPSTLAQATARNHQEAR